MCALVKKGRVEFLEAQTFWWTTLLARERKKKIRKTTRARGAITFRKRKLLLFFSLFIVPRQTFLFVFAQSRSSHLSLAKIMKFTQCKGLKKRFEESLYCFWLLEFRVKDEEKFHARYTQHLWFKKNFRIARYRIFFYYY